MTSQELKRVPAQTVADSQARGARSRYLAQARALDVFMPDALRQWAELENAIGKVQDDVFLDFPALTQMHLLLREIDRRGIEGDIVECGVYRAAEARRSWVTPCDASASSVTCRCLIRFKGLTLPSGHGFSYVVRNYEGCGFSR